MIIGFTGTAGSVPVPQRVGILVCLSEWADELHHGDCIGADAVAHAAALFLTDLTDRGHMPIVIHPPSDPKKRAWCSQEPEYGLSTDPLVKVLPERGYHERNHDIVDACHRLLAAPHGPQPGGPRTGEWATVRYARRVGTPVTIIWPDGERVDDEGR